MPVAVAVSELRLRRGATMRCARLAVGVAAAGWSCITAASSSTASATAGISTATGAGKLNLLMIISDQHRWDCVGTAGNEIIHTPVLDKLAQDGVHFSNAYTVCPVCCPSRTSMLSGQTPEQTQVRGNADIKTAPRAMTYDRVLLANGWLGEYTGKYHSPYNYTRDENGTTYYSKPVQWLNGQGPINPPAGVLSLSDAYRARLDKRAPGLTVCACTMGAARVCSGDSAMAWRKAALSSAKGPRNMARYDVRCQMCVTYITPTTAGGSDLEYCMGIEVPLLLCLEHVPCVALPRHEPLKELQRGQLLDGMYRRPYWADIADLRYEQAFNATLLALSNKFIREGPPRPLLPRPLPPGVPSAFRGAPPLFGALICVKKAWVFHPALCV